MKLLRLSLLLPAFLLVHCLPASGAKAWINVTTQYVQNPSFDANTADGWTVTGNFQSQHVQYDCMEIFNGSFVLSQQLSSLPAGKYRLHVQGFYRTRDNNQAYNAHQNHSENITALLYAGSSEKKLACVYDQSFTNNLANNCWQQGNWWEGFRFYPNGMASAHEAFHQDCYQNVLEFELAQGQDVTIGIKNTGTLNGNWCCFDNFQLEYYADVDEPTATNVAFNEIMAANYDMFWSPSVNFDGWAELLNLSSQPVKLGGCYLSDDAKNLRKWHMPEEMPVLPANGMGLIWFDHNELCGIEAPFKLEVEGGSLYLSNSAGELMVSVSYPAALGRISYARNVDGVGEWLLTGDPTPLMSNTSSDFASQQLPKPEVNQASQIFQNSLMVNVSVPEGAILRYTTDGTVPTLTTGKTSTTGVFTIYSTTNYRFRFFRDGWLPSDVVTRSYIKKQHDFTIPVLSVVSPDDYLYGNEHGVMVRGTNGKPGRGQDQPCNWNMDWERPVNFVYMTPGGEQLFQQDAILEMCGGWSRAWEPHSFKLKGNKVFGTPKTLDYPFFAEKPYIRNRTLQIRNGGNDNWCRIKDGALETMILRSGIDLDAQSYNPVVHYINGKYIGVINMREPNNKHFVFANRGWDDDIIDLFEMDADSGYVQKCGTREAFERLYQLSARVNEPGVYDEIRQVLDVDEYINNMAATLYLGGNDWPQNNIKGYRLHDGGRFRFVSFDQDFAFEERDPFTTFFNKKTYTFHFLYDKQVELTLEIEMVTILQNLLKNEQFRRQFIDVFCLMGGSVFEKTRARAIIDELANRVKAMMAFENGSPMNTANDMKNKLNTWMTTVTGAMKRYSLFQLSSVPAQNVQLSADTQGATLFVNGLEVPYADFNGQLFAPVRLRAEAPAGFVFSGWKDGSGQMVSTSEEMDLPSGSVNLTATFAPNASAPAVPVVVNEVSAANDSYVNDYFKRADWVELYNTTGQPVDVEGMYLSNDRENLHKCKIVSPEGVSSVIPPYGHLVVWCDKRDPISQHHASFKLDDGDGVVCLTAADDSWTNELPYPGHDMDHTVGRFPDGSENVFVMDVATIGAKNLKNSYATEAPTHTGIALREAVPAGLSLKYMQDLLIANADKAQSGRLAIYSMSGQQLFATDVTLRTGRNEWTLPAFNDGCYVARLTAADGTTVACKLLVKK